MFAPIYRFIVRKAWAYLYIDMYMYMYLLRVTVNEAVIAAEGFRNETNVPEPDWRSFVLSCPGFVSVIFWMTVAKR